MSAKKALTTGEIADFCSVNFRTVIRWIDRGHLKAYKLPGRGDNRVQVDDFIAFLNANNMPIPLELHTGAQSGPKKRKAAGPEMSPSQKRALIIEGEPSTASMIQQVLETQNYLTEIATNGIQAGTLMVTFNPQLVTLDLNMPGQRGLEVIRFIRGHHNLHHINLLVISAMAHQELNLAIAAGADQALGKPFSKDDLLDHLDRIADTSKYY